MKRTRKLWTDAEIWRLIAFHPDTTNKAIARKFKRPYSSIIGMATKLGLRKTREHLSSIPHKTGMVKAGKPFRFPKGHVPLNAGKKAWWNPGRSVHTRFKKGQFPPNRDPDFYVIGALRVNTDGYIDMRTSFRPGAHGWRGLHLVLWEDAHGPLPKGHCLRFKDGDGLNVELDNLELITRRDNMLRNSVHLLPPELKSTIHMLGRLKRRIREKQDGRPAQSPVRHA